MPLVNNQAYLLFRWTENQLAPVFRLWLYEFECYMTIRIQYITRNINFIINYYVFTIHSPSSKMCLSWSTKWSIYYWAFISISPLSPCWSCWCPDYFFYNSPYPFILSNIWRIPYPGNEPSSNRPSTTLSDWGAAHCRSHHEGDVAIVWLLILWQSVALYTEKRRANHRFCLILDL